MLCKLKSRNVVCCCALEAKTTPADNIMKLSSGAVYILKCRVRVEYLVTHLVKEISRLSSNPSLSQCVVTAVFTVLSRLFVLMWKYIDR